jgi:hypothetical protein
MHVIADAALTDGPLLDHITTACVLRNHFNLENDPQENMIAAYLDARGILLAAERVSRNIRYVHRLNARHRPRCASLQRLGGRRMSQPPERRSVAVRL